jgi:hypothetical protein
MDGCPTLGHRCLMGASASTGAYPRYDKQGRHGTPMTLAGLPASQLLLAPFCTDHGGAAVLCVMLTWGSQVNYL